jgi:hypothetical protein
MKWRDVPHDPICDDETLEALYEFIQGVSESTTNISIKADATMSLSVNRKKPAAATGSASSPEDRLA